MNRELIRDLAITGGIYDCITDPYDKLNNGDPYSSVMVDLERFAEKIVRECIEQCEKNADHEYLGAGSKLSAFNIKKHFGVED
jgi:hypothetical protein